MPAGVSAYTPLANVTLGSSASSVTFSSINQTYRDLVLILSGTSSGGDILLQLNGDTNNANYSWVSMRGDGSAASSSSGNGPIVMFSLAGNSTINIMDYSATDKQKTFLTRFDHTSNGTNARAIRWANTAAITSMTLTNATFPAGFTMALYGVSP
jgi:hypothetical protein